MVNEQTAGSCPTCGSDGHDEGIELDAQGVPEKVTFSPYDKRLNLCGVRTRWHRLEFRAMWLMILALGLVLLRVCIATEEIELTLKGLPPPMTAAEIERLRQGAKVEYARELMVRKHREEAGRDRERKSEDGRAEPGGRDR